MASSSSCDFIAQPPISNNRIFPFPLSSKQRPSLKNIAFHRKTDCFHNFSSFFAILKSKGLLSNFAPFFLRFAVSWTGCVLERK